MIGVIVGREVRIGLVTPLLWVLLGVGQLVIAWVFLQVVEDFSGLSPEARTSSLTQDLAMQLFGFAALVALLAAPLLAMRMISGERRDGTYELIGASPVRVRDLVIGKLLGLVILITPLCLLPLVNLLLLMGAAPLDLGHLAAASLGLWLAAVFFCSVGLYASSLSAHPGAAVLVAFGLLLGFSVVGRAESLTEQSLSLFGWLSWSEHLFWFLTGAVRLSDLAYFGLFVLFFAALTHRRLVNLRWS